MQILQFQPILKQIRWGGTRLGTLLNKPLGDGENYAESWEICDHGDDQSVVADGPCAGATLHELVVENGRELFGTNTHYERFPLLIKYLDACDRLSLQVHPNDFQARRLQAGQNGKTEAWVIIHADPGSRLYAGLKPGVDRLGLRAAIDAGEVEPVIHSFAVSAGDCIYVPAGTVHAIGEGIVLAEIQQSSDATFRLHDWGRLDADGKPRQLHVDEALECVDFDRGPVHPVKTHMSGDGKNGIERLFENEFFIVSRYTLHDWSMNILTGGLYDIFMTLQGNGTLACGDDRRRLAPGTTLLVPAAAERIRIDLDEPMILLSVTSRAVRT